MFFFDSQDVTKVGEINAFCRGKINASYGIGTFLTNDTGVAPLNMVIKLTAIRVQNKWVSTVKLSDDKGNHTGDSDAVNMCKQIVRIE